MHTEPHTQSDEVYLICTHYMDSLQTVSAISYTVCKEKQLHYPRKVTKSTNKGPKLDCKYVNCRNSTWPPSHKIELSDLKPRASFRERREAGIKCGTYPPCQNLTLLTSHCVRCRNKNSDPLPPQTFSPTTYIPAWLNEPLKTWTVL